MPDTPQQNGIVERKNRTLIEAARTILDEYKTSDQFWAEAVNTACHAINRLYLHKILQKIACELLTGKKPNVSYFRVFGSKCFILNKKPRSSKFAPKVDEGLLLGYASNAHGYRVFNNSFGCVEIVCDVTFDESNGSQKEQVHLNDADDKLAPQQAIENLAIGEIRPQERNDQEASKDGPNTDAAGNSGGSRKTGGNSIGLVETLDKSLKTSEMLMKKPLIKTKKMMMIIQFNTKLKHLTQEFTKVYNVIIPWIIS
jgi:hypothetical protein